MVGSHSESALEQWLWAQLEQLAPYSSRVSGMGQLPSGDAMEPDASRSGSAMGLPMYDGLDGSSADALSVSPSPLCELTAPASLSSPAFPRPPRSGEAPEQAEESATHSTTRTTATKPELAANAAFD